MRSWSCSSSSGSERLNHLASMRQRSMIAGSIGRWPGAEGSCSYRAYSGNSMIGLTSCFHGTAAERVSSMAAVLGPPRLSRARSPKERCELEDFFMTHDLHVKRLCALLFVVSRRGRLFRGLYTLFV